MIEIDIDDIEMGIDYADCGPWRSYHLTAYGTTIEEAYENAVVFEIDQEGGEIGDCPLKEYGGEVEKRGMEMIEQDYNESKLKNAAFELFDYLQEILAVEEMTYKISKKYDVCIDELIKMTRDMMTD